MKTTVRKVVSIIAFLTVFTPSVFANSQQAYQDYLYQSDLYRQKYSAFAVAKNEYLKFKTLTSQSTALEKTIAMIAQRDQLLRGYLLLLNEKLNEDSGLSATSRQTYQTLIANEVVFLEGQSKLVESIGSLEDAENASRQLESHYNVLQSSVRQTIGGIALGKLATLVQQFDIALADAKALVSTNRGSFSPQKQATIDRWLLQITNIRSLYQQKIDQMSSSIAQFKGSSLTDQDKTLLELKGKVSEARQYLIEGSGYLGELVTTLSYKD